MMKRILSALFLTAVVFTVNSHATSEYSFTTDGTPAYYSPSSYETVYGSQYNYGGPNVVDYQLPKLEYGLFSTTQTGIMEQSVLPGLQEYSYTAFGSNGNYGISAGSTYPEISVSPPITGEFTIESVLLELPGVTRFTELTDDFLLSNGAVGRISVPAIGIKNYYVWEDTSDSSMRKGVGHFSSTSVWEGNVGVAGHNRGAAYSIGEIKDLERGDRIIYKTSAGERTYAVETVKTIRNDDWSYLESTSDNRLTIITCVAGNSNRRWVVQAVEI